MKPKRVTGVRHEEHKDHQVGRDAFAELAGVSRYIEGDLYCLTCHIPLYIPNEEGD